MEGFKSLPKMQCFKEGGAVKSKYAGGGSCYKKGGHAESEEISKDIAQDKSMVKRGVKQHEEALHKDEPKTKLKLKTGGKSKLVGKYKAGGAIEMKKDSGDKDDIKKIKLAKPKKAAAPSAAMMAEPTLYKKGGAAKKYAEGGMASYSEKMNTPQGRKLLSDAKLGSMLKMSPLIKDTALSEISESDAAKGLRNYGRMYKQGLGMKSDTGYEYKKGGAAKKYADGGMVTDEERARMPAGKLPQQIVDEEATKENTETREMVAGPLRKLKQGLLETFKSKTKTPMKHGGKACQ